MLEYLRDRSAQTILRAVTPSPDLGTHRGRGREAGLATVGGETLKQS